MKAIAAETKANLLREQFIPDHVFIYVANGSLRIFDSHQHYTFKRGEAFIALKNKLAKYELLGDPSAFEPILFCFDEAFIKDFQKKYKVVKSDYKTQDGLVRIRKSELLTSFIASIKPYYKGVMTLDDDFEDLKYQELLLVLLKNQPELSGLLFDFAPAEKINLEAFMNRNYAFNVSLAQFASLTGRSLSGFKRDFSRIFAQSPSRWLTQKRLDEAHFLIRNQHKKPSEFYLELGFESLSHFSFAFKKQFGYAPTDAAM